MLNQGNDLTSIHNALVSQLQGESRVAGAELDPDSGVVWAVFKTGETHCLWVIDDTEADADPDATTATPKRLQPTPASPPARGAAEKAGVRAQPILTNLIRMPANNKAFLGNALCRVHATRKTCDGTDLIEDMLDARSYEVTRRSGTTSLNADGTVANLGLETADFKTLTDFDGKKARLDMLADSQPVVSIGNAQIQWNAFTAGPPFDNKEPR